MECFIIITNKEKDRLELTNRIVTYIKQAGKPQLFLAYPLRRSRGRGCSREAFDCAIVLGR